MRDPVSAGVKLAVTLRHLATGDSYTTLQYAFRVASSTIEKFVLEVCDAITRAYRDQVRRCPTLPISQRIGCRSSPPEVKLSACHGCPGWKAYFNQMSTSGRQPLPQLQGLPLYCTSGPGGWRLQVPVGGRGGSRVNFRCSDFQDLRHIIEDGSIGFPDSESLGIDGPKVNFFILGDDAFPLKLWLMRPYYSHGMDLKERVFNYRISQGRNVVENAFGILTSRFRIFHSPLQKEPLVVNRVVMACLVLHNLLRIRYPTAQQEDFLGGSIR